MAYYLFLLIVLLTITTLRNLFQLQNLYPIVYWFKDDAFRTTASWLKKSFGITFLLNLTGPYIEHCLETRIEHE